MGLLLQRVLIGVWHRLTSFLIRWYLWCKISSSCHVEPSVELFPSTRLSNLSGKDGGIRIGAGSVLRGELLTFPDDGKIEMGESCYLGENSHIWSAKSICIGNRVLIAHDVDIFDNTTHPVDDAEARHRQFIAIRTLGHPGGVDLNARPVVIKDDVWIAAKSIILPGVTIEEGAVVGAGSVVTKDVSPYTLVAGNPACPVRVLKVPRR